jgi:hypothetical protein
MLRKMPLPALMSLLMLLAQPALALEIDRIEVRSQLGQPLLAEIPVIAASPAELDRLQVQLASPATFARIGLARPQGVLADLQFKIVRNMRGNPVIRITSTLPVQEEFLTFLIQVDCLPAVLRPAQETRPGRARLCQRSRLSECCRQHRFRSESQWLQASRPRGVERQRSGPDCSAG